MDNLSFIIPEFFISLSIMFLLLLGVYKKNSRPFVLFGSEGQKLDSLLENIVHLKSTFFSAMEK